MGRVLVVEDDDVVRGVVTANLQRAGHLVLEAETAQAALDEVGARPTAPEIAVLDVGLPDMDGFALVGALREHPQMADMPVIFLSGRVSEQDIAHGRALGCTYLTKPFIASALLAAIERNLAVAPAAW